jgi:hypothetical protein
VEEKAKYEAEYAELATEAQEEIKNVDEYKVKENQEA